MQTRGTTMFAAAGSLILAGTALAQGVDPEIDPRAGIAEFTAENPDSGVLWENGRIVRLYGKAFAGGLSAEAAASQFVEQHADMFGLEPEDLAAIGPFASGDHIVPMMYDDATGNYKFISFHYTQVDGKVPVYGAQMRVLVRNVPGYPVVLVSADLRDLGQFDARAVSGTKPVQMLQDDVADAFRGVTRFSEERTVVFAGMEGEFPAPRLAHSFVATNGKRGDLGYSRVRMVVDAVTGETLHQENLVVEIDVEGSVKAMVTTELGADFCSDENETPLPYARVSILGGNAAFADENGDFVIPHGGSADVTVQSQIWGQYFRVFNQSGSNALQSQIVTPAGPADFVHNAANTSELARAEVNGYFHANLVRDFTLNVLPTYPVINNQTEMTVNVNINNSCNAFYDGSSINFYTSGGGCPNTAMDSVVYHEYGHHLVASGGSGQGAYGEGMSDCMSVIITDSPVLASGWSGTCGVGLRNADNDCQYSAANCTTNCGSAIHSCGRLISGCVWDLRNSLLSSDPATYLEITADLTVNSILLHNGTSITPAITIDFLTLDDDNGDIGDGSPHYNEINAAFSAHNMPAPELNEIGFQFPNGLPELIDPSGGDTVLVNVVGVTGTPEPGTGDLVVSTDGGVQTIPLVVLGPNQYEAVFPASSCGEIYSYYFTAESSTGNVTSYPTDAPGSLLTAVGATDITLAFSDDFETDQGWTVVNALTDGQWNRGTPVGGGDRGDPAADSDGSGQCYLTDNVDGNSDVDGGTTTLISPVMDASDPASFISYDRWFSNTFGNAPFQDPFVVEVTSNGSTWVNLETVGPAGAEVDGGWFSKSFRVGDVVDNTSQFQIRFIASDLEPGSVVEAAVDAVEIRVFSCADTGCESDTNGDDVVDVQDLVNVVLQWGSDDASADVNGDGLVDVQDLVQVVLEWGSC